MSSDTFRRRRQRLLNRLGDGLLVLPTAPLALRNGDVHHPFRPSSDFYYLTGFDEPESTLVARRLSPSSHQAILFLRPRDKEREVWDGPRLGPRRAVARLGVDEARPLEALYERLEELLKETDRLFYTWGADEGRDRDLKRIFERVAAAAARRNPKAHPDIIDPHPAIASLRLVKERGEIEVLFRAAAVTVEGHLKAMRAAAPGTMEYEVQAAIEETFRRGGSPRNGYETIVASGPNASTLHYVSNQRRMRAGDLLLVDAGAEVDMYTADVTRTFPVSGRFTEPQAEIYELVLRAQKAAIRAVRPGRDWRAPHRAAVSVVLEGLRRLRILRGDRRRLRRREAHKRWFMHGTSHWLGLDVHDAGGYEDEDGKPRKLGPGMVLTVEPGLYFNARDRSVPERYRGIGVRIEDDVLVTRSGARVLTAGAPKELLEVERLCRDREA